MSDPIQKRYRQTTRLRSYDYAANGAYFFTLCAHERTHLFGEVLQGEMRLNPFGEIVQACWLEIPDHFRYVNVDAFMVMPNHVHGILWIQRAHNLRVSDGVGARHASPLRGQDDPESTQSATAFRSGVKSGSLGAIVGSFKSAVTKRINLARGTPGFPVWQRNYHDRVVRVERELEQTRQYIVDNPLKWFSDEENMRA